MCLPLSFDKIPEYHIIFKFNIMNVAIGEKPLPYGDHKSSSKKTLYTSFLMIDIPLLNNLLFYQMNSAIL